MAAIPEKKQRLSFETRVLLLTLGAGTPGTLVAFIMLWTIDFITPKVQWTLTVFIACFWLGFSFALREKVVRPLQTLSNLLAALLEGDYSIRSRATPSDDALGLAMAEVNALSKVLREQRLGALEATALLRKVMEEIEVAVFAFDNEGKVRLVNRAGERLLEQPAERITGKTAEALGLNTLLEGDPSRTLDASFPGAKGRWEIRRSSF